MKRRNVLKVAGAGALALGTVAGKASADQSYYEYEFFGCSQVCTSAKYAKAAVVMPDGSCEFPSVYHNRRESNRGNLWDGDIYCLSVEDVNAAAIVGLYIYDGAWGAENRDVFAENKGRCAQNYPDCDDYWE